MKKYFMNLLSFMLILALIFSSANINTFSYANTYGLSEPKIENSLTTWDCIYFGNYWQENYEPLELPNELKDGVNHEGEYNGRIYTDSDGTEFMYIEQLYGQAFVKKAPIKWRVLSVNGNDAFLLSEYNMIGVYNSDYINAKNKYTDSSSLTWENSIVRKCLNENFYDSAFTVEEQSAILTTTVSNTGGATDSFEKQNDTVDKIYLLSLDEATNKNYGFSENNEASQTRFTESTKFITAISDMKQEDRDWSLRTQYMFIRNLGRDAGKIEKGYFVNNLRPCLHLDLSSSVWSKAGTVSCSNGNTPTPTVTPTQTPSNTQTPDVDNKTTPQPTNNKSISPTSTPVTAPSKPTKLSAKNNKKKTVTLTWKKVKGAKGYQVQYATNTTFSKRKTKTTTKNKLVVKSLKKKKTYSFRVRAYKLDGKKKVYGKWSTVKKVKIKK